MVRRCDVCGFETDATVCPICSTVLLRDEAICPRCGKIFPGRIAVCDSCGASVASTPEPSTDDEAVRILASVPGISEEQARELVARGFHDFSDIVRLALPESAVKQGLHHAIARRALLAEITPKVRRVSRGDRCPVCGSRWPKDAERCPTCGSAATTVLRVEKTEEDVDRVAGEIVGASGEKDFRERLETIRQKIEDTFQGVDPKDVMREEYRRQVDAWRAKGFDVAPLETLLAADVDEFRKQAVRLIRSQIRTKAAAGTFRCPLCREPLSREAEECGNCGAKLV